MKSWIRVAAVLTGLAGGTALACSCKTAGDLVPRDGSTNVPTNVVPRALFNFAPDQSTVRLTTDDGTPVPFTFSEGPGAHVWTIQPTAALSPSTIYRFEVASLSSRFTTGAGDDVTAPAKATLEGATYTSAGGASCGTSRNWALSLTGGDDDLTAREDVVVLVRAQSDEILGATLLGAPTLRTGLCSPNFKAPEGAELPLRVEVMDLAGNLSGPGASTQVPGCSMAPAGALVLLAVTLFRRRKIQ